MYWKWEYNEKDSVFLFGAEENQERFWGQEDAKPELSPDRCILWAFGKGCISASGSQVGEA